MSRLHRQCKAPFLEINWRLAIEAIQPGPVVDKSFLKTPLLTYLSTRAPLISNLSVGPGCFSWSATGMYLSAVETVAISKFKHLAKLDMRLDRVQLEPFRVLMESLPCLTHLTISNFRTSPLLLECNSSSLRVLEISGKGLDFVSFPPSLCKFIPVNLYCHLEVVLKRWQALLPAHCEMILSEHYQKYLL